MNSALQRARKTVDEQLPEQSQQETLRALGDERLREIVEDYMDAMHRGDVHAVVAMLAEDAAWSMPPLASWFRRPAIGSGASSRPARCRASGAGATSRPASTARRRSAPTPGTTDESAYVGRSRSTS